MLTKEYKLDITLEIKEFLQMMKVDQKKNIKIRN
jgi:hypothetical protein